MKCLITDAVYPGIAEELKKFMDIKTSDGKPLSKEEMIREIADADVLIMRVDPKIDRDKYKYVGRELRGKTLGVMGFGRIGRRVAELAKAFGMDIVAYDPFLKPEDFEREGAKGMGIDELIRVSDFISLHIPLTPETKDLFNKKSIAEMKDGAVVLNMSRGGIVNEQDMYEALCEGRIGGYAADVMENELAGSGLSGNDEFQSPLFSCDNFVISPHIGAQTVDASRDIGLHIIEKVKEVMNLK